jgi:tetratricopeptide (TPR) repeat protein
VPDNKEVAAKLARAYTFDEDPSRAAQVYDTYLSKIKPGDPDAPPTLGLLLLDLDRPAEGLAFLEARLARNKDDIEAAANIVRAYARMGERQKAIDAVNDLARIQVSRTDIRNEVANSLYQSDDLEIADLIYDQVLANDPNSQTAMVGKARVQIRSFLPVQARKTLEGFQPNEATQRIYFMTVAEYYQLVGEYSEAKQIYQDFLRRDESDHEARLALGAMYGRLGSKEYLHEYEKGKAEFAKIPPERSIGRRARLGFGETLEAQRRYAEAAELFLQLLNESPGYGDAAAELTRTLARLGEFDKAEAVARSWLASNPRNEGGSIAVRLALGKILLDARRHMEAAKEFEILLTKPAGRIPSTYYGLARANSHVGQGARAEQTLTQIMSMLAADSRVRLLLADEYSGDYEDAMVIELASAVVKFDPQNLAALIRLADAQQRAARQSGNIHDAAATCNQILALSPTNVRGHLALARSYAIAQDYPVSVQQYDRLISIDPEYLVPQREKARVYYADKRYAAAAATYAAAVGAPAEDQLAADLMGIARRDPRLKPLIDPYLVAKLPGPTLRTEVAKLAAATPEPEVQAALQRSLIDYDARVANQTYFKMEGEAKQLKGLYNWEAIPAYKNLIAVEPDNAEARFDLGQTFGALKVNHNELEAYSGLLTVDPLNREGAIATERSNLEISPQLRMGGGWFDQDGRDGLTHIQRVRASMFAIFPFNDEVDYVGVGYSRVRYSPPDDYDVFGNIASFVFSKRYNERGIAYGQVNYEQYNSLIESKPTFDVGTYYAATSLLNLRASGFYENVVENGESMRQNITRGGFRAGADYTCDRYWTVGGTYRLIGYSDENIGNQFNAYSSVALSLAPKMLKFTLSYDYWTYANQSILGPGAPENMRGTIHPYFAPANYQYVEARVEWYHWLSRDYFVHSNQLWYSLQYGIGYDNSFNAYNNFRALLSWDVKSWFSIQADAMAQVSPVYNMGQVMGWLVFRCPCCCK